MIITKIYKDELLSSYIFRLSRLNFTNVINITNFLFTSRKLFLRDIDLYPFQDEELKKSQNVVTPVLINNHQLLTLVGYLEETINTQVRHRWLTPLQKHNYGKVFYGTRFCPKCLKEEPYIKLYWRLLFYNICPKHKCYLHNYCPKCKQSLKFPNKEHFQEIYQCYNCNFDLRATKVTLLKLNSLEIQYQNKLLNILEKGYYKLNNRYYYSIGLFYLLRILIKNIMKVKKIPTYYIEELPPIELSYLLTYSLILLNKFPHRLNRFYKKNKISNINRILDKYRYKTEYIPCWFLSNIHYNTISTRWYF